MTQAAILAASGSPGTTTGFKNRLINGNMNIDQRNAGASVTVPGGGTYTVDRWFAQASQASKYTVQQNSGNAPVSQGFNQCLKLTSSSSYSLAAGDYFQIQQSIEGFNTADLGWGTASAKTVTLSFWVNASVTGTYGMFFINNSGDRLYPTSYTVNAANTWEYKTITVAGDTTGTWNTTTSVGIRAAWTLGYGSTYTGATPNVWGGGTLYVPSGCVNFMGTSGATFYLTGAQLEVGTTATNFDFRSYGQELSLCQRYYEKSYNLDTVPGTASTYNGFTQIQGTTDTSSNASAPVWFKVTKRTNPTMIFYNADTGATGTWGYVRSGANAAVTANADQASMANLQVYGGVGAAWTAVKWYGHWTASAEL